MNQINTEEKKVLIVDDEAGIRRNLHFGLTQHGFTIDDAEDGLSALAQIESSFHKGTPYNFVITDMVLPDINGLKLLEVIKSKYPTLPVIIITGYGTIQSAVESIKAGAFHFLSKPFVPDDLRTLVNRALEKRRLNLENLYLRQELKKDERSVLVYQDEPMDRIMDMVTRVAPTDFTVLITGESGTGKELVARAIHHASPRAEGPFVQDADGNVYVDLGVGIGVHNAGHRPPQVTRAAKAQLDKLTHICYMVATYKPYTDLAEVMAGICPPGLTQSIFLNSGSEAVEQVKAADFDIVVLDIGLPELDGLEVCRRVRAEGHAVPVLILTARADEVDTVVGLDAGADDMREDDGNWEILSLPDAFPAVLEAVKKLGIERP